MVDMMCTVVANQTQVAHRDPHLEFDLEPHDHRRHMSRGIQLKFPHFDRESPVGWVFKASHYFEFHQTPLVHRLLMASYHMEVEVLV